MTNDKWQMINDKWQMTNDKWYGIVIYIIFYVSIDHIVHFFGAHIDKMKKIELIYDCMNHCYFIGSINSGFNI